MQKSSFLHSNCVKIEGGWGFAPDPTGGAHSAPLNPLAAIREPFRDRRVGGRGREEGKGRGGEGKVNWQSIKFLILIHARNALHMGIAIVIIIAS